MIIHSYWAAGQEGGGKKKNRDFQLKSYKVVDFTLEQNHLQWQISKAICMWFPWKAGDPKFLCLTGSNLPYRTSRFFLQLLWFIALLRNSQFTFRIRILGILTNAKGYCIEAVTKNIFKDGTSGTMSLKANEGLECSDKALCGFFVCLFSLLN